MAGCYGTHPEDVARERELHRYLDAQAADERHEEEAERQTAENIAECKADCIANPDHLGEALAGWMNDPSKCSRLALAIQMAAGLTGCTPKLQYIEEIVAEAADAWAADNAIRVTADDVAESERDAAEDARCDMEWDR